MPKYKVVMHYSDGSSEEENEVFDSESAANDHGLYLVSCCSEGAETLNLSNPGDYPLEYYEEPDFEVIEVDD